MKTTILWVIIAMLIGASVFGIYKSLELVANNLILSNSLNKVKAELDTTQTALKASRQALGDSYMKNAELEERLAQVDKKLEKQSKDIEGYLSRVSILSEKLQETAKDNASLSSRNKDMTNEFLRNKLETEEMRKKLSSIEELKKAIKELKVKLRRSPRLKPPKALKPIKAITQKKEVSEKQENKILKLLEQKDIENELLSGNCGFLVKDGRSTFERIVDVRMVPDESGEVPISNEKGF